MIKRGVLLLIVLLVLPIVYSEEVIIPETFTSGTTQITSYFYTGSSLVATKDSTGVVKYYSSDRLGSNRLTTDSSGVKIGETKTLPFGEEVLNTNNNKFTFTGKELDSELYYFGARYYDASTGRFTSIDPVAENHDYSYVANNPINFVDPDGRTEKSGNAIVIIASPESDWNGAVYGDLDSTISKIRDNFENVYVDTVSTANEYFEAFAKGAEAVGGTFDFYYGTAHGTSISVNLGKEELYEYQFRNKDLSVYFSTNARGCQLSCSGADTTITNNFVKSLSNSANIPISGLLKSEGVYFNSDLSLSSYDFIQLPGLTPGLGNRFYGQFDSNNGLSYSISFKDGKYVVEGFGNPNGFNNAEIAIALGVGNLDNLWETDIPLPNDFDVTKAYHFVSLRDSNVFTHTPK